MKTKHYFNTTNQEADFVLKETKNCMSQEENIFIYFSDGQKYTASDIWSIYGKPKNYWDAPVPLTSIRRAITNLTYDGRLVKLEETKIGLYGKPEHYYRVRGQISMF